MEYSLPNQLHVILHCDTWASLIFSAHSLTSNSPVVLSDCIEVFNCTIWLQRLQMQKKQFHAQRILEFQLLTLFNGMERHPLIRLHIPLILHILVRSLPLCIRLMTLLLFTM